MSAKESLTLSECAAVASGRISKKRPRVTATTRKWYAGSMRRLIEYLGDKEVTAVTVDDLSYFQDVVESKQTLSPSTRNNYKRGIRDIFSRLSAMGYDVVSFDFDFEKETRGVKRVSDENHHRLMGVSGVRDALMVKLVYESGVRVGGLNSMRVSTTTYWVAKTGEYQVAAKVWEKGVRHKKENIIYGTHVVGLLLCAWLDVRKNLLAALEVEDHDMLFINTLTGSPISTEYISGIFWKMKQAARIPQDEPVNAHAGRHAFAIRRIMAGSPPNAVQKWLGHSSIKTTLDEYGRLQQDEAKKLFFDEANRPD